MVTARHLRAANQLAAHVVVHTITGMQEGARIVARKMFQKGRIGHAVVERQRRSVETIFKCLGPLYFRRAYRMSYESFLILHEKLKEGIRDAMQAGSAKREKLRRRSNGIRWKGNYRRKVGSGYQLPPVSNGVIDTSVRLACALRYFAGGSPYDIMGKYGISHTEVLQSVWYVVEAINCFVEFHISYPSDHQEQQKIADKFRRASAVDFDNCAGAIDGLLIWIQRPTIDDARRSGIGQKKFFCGRKHKFGLNLQAVSDKNGRFLDVSIKKGGSSSDCLAFEASDLFLRLEDGLLSPGLVLFGDNAYLNTMYLATPYQNVSGGSKDNYNFFHSQVRRYCRLMVFFYFFSRPPASNSN